GMISRHHAVMRLDTRRTVYLLPLTMVFVLFAGATLALIAQRGRLSRGKMQLILLVLLTSSVVSVVSDPGEKRRMGGPGMPATTSGNHSPAFEIYFLTA